MDSLLHRKANHILPPHTSESQLVDEFVDFFSGKIDRIRDGLDSQVGYSPIPAKQCSSRLCEFRLVSEFEISKIIRNSSDSSSTHPMPTHLLKTMLPCVCIIYYNTGEHVFQKCSYAIEPEAWYIIPSSKKKKAGLDLLLQTFRPVSNLPFLSQAIEKSCSLTIGGICM